MSTCPHEMSSSRGGEMRNQKAEPPIKKVGVRHNMIYDIEFKRAVVLYANTEGTRAAKRCYGVSESNIRRWKKIHGKSVDPQKPPMRSILKNPMVGRPRARSRTKNRVKIIEGDLDSMPLQQRLKATQGDVEHVLHSQPLSPTKLKVTRQSKLLQKPAIPLVEEEVSLKWDNHHSNIQTMFPNLLSKEQYVDATLVAEGQTLKCHRIILSLSSPYFEEVLSNIGPFQHPVLFMKDVPFWILKSLCDFIYTGEVQILQNKVEELLAVAESLKIRGLCKNNEDILENDVKNFRPESQFKQEPDFDERGFDRRDVRKYEKVNFTEPMDKKPQLKERRQEKFDSKDKKRNQSSLPASESPLLKPSRSSKLLQQTDVPNIKGSKVLRSSTVQRKPKPDDKSKCIFKKEVLDTYDLLQPLYEEVQSEPVDLPVKPKEVKSVPVKRSVSKKIRKRKISDTREDSPLPVLSKRGTRSRPNRKIPKFYQPPCDTRKTRSSDGTVESTIIREPHTDQADPLLQLEDIKTEPLDESAIEIEDNVVCFNENEIIDDELMGQEEKGIEPTFKKMRVMDMEEIDGKSGEMVKIVDVASIRSPSNDILEEDPLNFHQNNTSITISNVESLVEGKDESVDIGFKICEVRSQSEENGKGSECGERTELVESAVELPKSDGTHIPSEIKIANVFSENQAERKDGTQVENEQNHPKDNASSEIEPTTPNITTTEPLGTEEQDYFDHDVPKPPSDSNESTDPNRRQDYDPSIVPVAQTSQNPTDFDKVPPPTEKLNETIPIPSPDLDSQNLFGTDINLEESTAQLDNFPLVDLVDGSELQVIDDEKTDEVPWERSNCVQGPVFMSTEPTMDPTLSAMVDYGDGMTVQPEGCSGESLKGKTGDLMEELEGAISINADRYQYDVVAENFTACANSLVDDKMDFTEDNVNFDDDNFQISESITGQLGPSMANDSELETIVNDLSKIVGESQDE